MATEKSHEKVKLQPVVETKSPTRNIHFVERIVPGMDITEHGWHSNPEKSYE